MVVRGIYHVIHTRASRSPVHDRKTGMCAGGAWFVTVRFVRVSYV